MSLESRTVAWWIAKCQALEPGTVVGLPAHQLWYLLTAAEWEVTALRNEAVELRAEIATLRSVGRS